MENDILEALGNIGYTGPMLDKKCLMNAVSGGPKSKEYTELVHYLTNELRIGCNIDECVNSTKGPEDSMSFLLELSSFLKELQCPFEKLTQGHMSDRLSTQSDKLILLDFLIGELMAARMVNTNKPEKKMELRIDESPTANDLKLLLLALKFNKPPANITPALFFQKLEPKLQESVKRAGSDLCGTPIFSGLLSEKQWETMAQVQGDLCTDYTIRREMLLKRLDCTIQSFQWSDKLKGQEDKIAQIFHSKRKQLKVDPEIDLSDLLAARDDLAIIEKTSSASVRKNTKSSLNKLIIGQVPDRGGRPSEQAAPPPEMPSWQQRSAGPSGGGGRGGRGGGRGGGYQDNFSRGNGNNDSFRGRSSDSYSRGGGGSYASSNQSHGSQSDRQSSYGSQSDRQSNYSSQGDRQSSYGNQSDRQSNYSSRGGDYNDRGRGSGRSFDSFQINKTTYSDQYVQDSQQNQQYGRENRDYDNPRGQRRGRSNYNRGNYR